MPPFTPFPFLIDSTNTSRWFLIVGTVLAVLSTWRLLRNAGLNPWRSLVPFANLYEYIRMAGLSWWLLPMLFVPIIGFFAWIWISVRVARAFGKDGWYGMAIALWWPVMLPILAYGNPVYQGPTLEDPPPRGKPAKGLLELPKVEPAEHVCPRCSYPLTGLARGATCPECGLPAPVEQFTVQGVPSLTTMSGAFAAAGVVLLTIAVEATEESIFKWHGPRQWSEWGYFYLMLFAFLAAIRVDAGAAPSCARISFIGGWIRITPLASPWPWRRRRHLVALRLTGEENFDLRRVSAEWVNIHIERPGSITVVQAGIRCPVDVETAVREAVSRAIEEGGRLGSETRQTPTYAPL